MEAFRGATEARLNSLEDKVKEHAERLTSVERTNGQIEKISTLLEMQIEINKEHTLTLRSINENLNNLNKGYENLDRRMEIVEDNQKIMKEKSTVDITEQFKRLIVYGLPSLLGGLILAALVYFLGLK